MGWTPAVAEWADEIEGNDWDVEAVNQVDDAIIITVEQYWTTS